MTINLEDNNPRIQYSVAQGVTQDTFAVPFEFFNDSDLIVYVDGVLKEEGVDYTITGGDGSTGNIEFVPAIPPEIQQVTGAVGGSQVIIFRRTAIERTSDFSSGADINRAALNEQLDILTAMVADAKDGIDRTIRSNPYEVAPDLSLPSINDRKGKVLAFHETTGAVLSGPSIASVQTVSDSATAIETAAANIAAIIDAPNQASAAAASAAAALVSEGAALVSENAASASASAALASENAAADLLDSFDDRYLGAKTSDPTLDNDGNALLLGALYYNSVDGVMKVYNGSVWLAAFASLAGTLIATNNLSDVVNVSASRTNLGLGTIATQNSNSVSITGGSIAGITDLAVADGGTGASDAAGALVNLGLTATAAELNILDGVTATAAELNILDGVTATTAELNILDGVTATTAELNILDGVTATAAELNIVDGASTTQAPLVLAQPSAFVDPENRIINGAFDFWQRGTSGTGAGYVAADRWRRDGSGGTTTQSRQSHTVGDKFGVNNPQFYLRQTVSGQSAASDALVIGHRIEGVRSYAGETVTVLGWARRSSGSGNMAVEGTQNFGTGGSPSADTVGISPTTITLTASWEPFAAVLTVPSISGKTLGTNNNDCLQLRFWISAGSNNNGLTNSLGIQTIGVDLWGIHIKRGTHTAAATDFYKAPELGPELERCRRYYRTTKNVQVTALTTAAGGWIVGEELSISPTMRIAPTASFTYADNGNMNGTPTIETSVDGIRLATATFATTTAGARGTFSNIKLDAEL